MRAIKARHWFALLILALYLASFHVPILLAYGRWVPKSAGLEMLQGYAQFPEYAFIGGPLVLFANWAIVLGVCFLFRGWWLAATILGSLPFPLAILLGKEALSFGRQPGLELGPGYYLWLSSMAFLAIGGVITRERTPSTRPPRMPGIAIPCCILGIGFFGWRIVNSLGHEWSVDRNPDGGLDGSLAKLVMENDFYAGRWMTWGPILLPGAMIVLMMACIALEWITLKPHVATSAAPLVENERSAAKPSSRIAG